jgi:hypothetical protein
MADIEPEEMPQLEACTPDELEFVRLIVECGNIKAAADKKWPDVSQRERKAHRWLKQPRVKAALAAEMASKAAEDPRQIRIWFEQCGFGIVDRIKMTAQLARDPKTGKNVKVQLLEYADELEGRAKKDKDEGGSSGFLERMVLGMAAAAGRRAIPAPQDAEVVEEADCRGASSPETPN